jgi:hypothetical protein
MRNTLFVVLGLFLLLTSCDPYDYVYNIGGEEEVAKMYSYKLESITLKNIPSDSWDTFNGAPDVYVVIKDNLNNTLYKSSTTDNLKNSNLPKTYYINKTVSKELTYKVYLYDEDDLTDDELMMYSTFISPISAFSGTSLVGSLTTTGSDYNLSWNFTRSENR